MGFLVDLFKKHRRSFLITLGFVQVVLVGLIDWKTGPDLAFSIFYLFPIFAAILSFGRKGGLIASGASAVVWFLADVFSRGTVTHPYLTLWNALVNLNFFFIITYVISALRAAQDKQEELIHFIVHDLRSPLSNMLMGLQALELPEIGTLNPCQREFLSRALSSGNWMTALINSILDLSRMEHDGLKLELGEVAIQDLLRESIEQLSMLAEQQDVELAMVNGADRETMIVDRALTVRVLVNLLSNAIKFTPRGKRVTLEAAPAAGGVRFSIRDQGPGVPQEFLARVFDKYEQMEARKAGAMVGSGLGLTFCRMSVQAQGGRIWMESQSHEGTTVRFILPADVERAVEIKNKAGNS